MNMSGKLMKKPKRITCIGNSCQELHHLNHTSNSVRINSWLAIFGGYMVMENVDN